MTRQAELSAFLDAVRTGFAAAPADAETRRCLEIVFARVAQPVPASETTPLRLPACHVLPDALRTASKGGPAWARVAATFATLEPALRWSRREGGAHASPNIAEGHANAMVVGPGGLERRDDVWLGVSLLAPHTRYPDHRHDPEEAYLVLSAGEFRRGDDPWFEPGLGGTLYNRPGITHAMRSGPAPLFAVWCLAPDEKGKTDRARS